MVACSFKVLLKPRLRNSLRLLKFDYQAMGQVDTLGLLCEETYVIAMLLDTFREERSGARWEGVVSRLSFEELRCGWWKHLLLAAVT